MTSQRTSNHHGSGRVAGRFLTTAIAIAILALHVYAVIAADGLHRAVTGS